MTTKQLFQGVKAWCLTQLSIKQDKLIAGSGVVIQDNVIGVSVTEETVNVTISSEVTGFDVEDLGINVYLNDETTPYTTITTDSSGEASVNIPFGNTYKLVFPDVTGCTTPSNYVRTAMIATREVEIEYVAVPVTGTENVTVVVLYDDGSSISAEVGDTVTCTVDGLSTSETTDSSGKVSFQIPYGKTYSITLTVPQGKYAKNGSNTRNYIASQTSRGVAFILSYVQVGCLIIANDGTEWGLTAWENAVSEGTYTNDDAEYIKVSNSDLASNNGVFTINIDMLRGLTNSNIPKMTWAGTQTLFNTIPLNGGSTSLLYYYDGLTASGLIQTEGIDRLITTNAVDYCLALVNETSYGIRYSGFLPSIGLWSIAWANRDSIDAILDSTRPDGVEVSGSYVKGTLSALTTNKWSSTQCSATSSWYWATGANYGIKTFSVGVVPFFALSPITSSSL